MELQNFWKTDTEKDKQTNKTAGVVYKNELFVECNSKYRPDDVFHNDQKGNIHAGTNASWLPDS